MIAIAPNITTTFWSQPGLHEGQEEFLTWLVAIDNSSFPPLVHSVSYSDEEPSLSLDYMSRINTELQKLGLRGLSILFCSLDDGAPGPSARSDPTKCNMFRPCFPTSSPYATSVGATQFSNRLDPICSMGGIIAGELSAECEEVGEIACSSDTGGVITSGGGKSEGPKGKNKIFELK